MPNLSTVMRHTNQQEVKNLKLKNKIISLTLCICAVSAAASVNVFALPSSDEAVSSVPEAPVTSQPDEPPAVQSEHVYSEPEGNYSSSYDAPSNNAVETPTQNYSNDYNNNYSNDYNNYNDYNNVQGDNYQPPNNNNTITGNTYSPSNAPYQGNTGPGYEYTEDGENTYETDVDNKLFDASSDIDNNGISSDDWDIALELDETGSGDDFNFIKNNNSSEDSVLYQLMLYGGVLLIAVGIVGIILVIVLTVKAKKRNKLAAHGSDITLESLSSDKIYKDPNKSGSSDVDISKADTDEIDLSKYDKYL